MRRVGVRFFNLITMTQAQYEKDMIDTQYQIAVNDLLFEEKYWTSDPIKLLHLFSKKLCDEQDHEIKNKILKQIKIIVNIIDLTIS